MNKIFIGSEHQFSLFFSLVQNILHSNFLCFDVLTQDPSLLKDRLTLKKVRAGAIFCKQGDQVITRLWLVRLEYGQAISLLCTASMKQLEALSFPLLILGFFFSLSFSISPSLSFIPQMTMLILFIAACIFSMINLSFVTSMQLLQMVKLNQPSICNNMCNPELLWMVLDLHKFLAWLFVPSLIEKEIFCFRFSYFNPFLSPSAGHQLVFPGERYSECCTECRGRRV